MVSAMGNKTDAYGELGSKVDEKTLCTESADKTLTNHASTKDASQNDGAHHATIEAGEKAGVNTGVGCA